MRNAVRAWHRSGTEVRFTKVSSVRKARLVIRNTERVPRRLHRGARGRHDDGRGRTARAPVEVTRLD